MPRPPIRSRRGPRKDRLIQTRVAQGLEKALKSEADRRRLSVSHLIRNVLEDTFDLVDNVVRDVDTIVAGSVELADQVRRDAEKMGFGSRGARGRSRAKPDERDDADGSEPAEQAAASDEQPELDDPTAEVDAWNAVTVNRPADCAKCRTKLVRGDTAHLGISANPDAPRVWLCDDCLEALS